MSSRRNQGHPTNPRGHPRARGAWRGQTRGGTLPNPTDPNPNPNRRMENIASVSRSSGLEKDGDALKDFKIQEEYREFIQGKLESFWTRYPNTLELDARNQQRQEVQENILILFRKLREGLVSSKRTDSFALEVYETSLYLATIFKNPKQINSIIPQLIPDLYTQIPSPEPHQTHNRLLTILISLLHHLLSGYPSQRTYRQILRSIPESMLSLSSHEQSSNAAAYTWITSVSSSLRTQNFAKFETLTRGNRLRSLLQDLDSSSPSLGLSTDLESLSISISVSPRSSRDLARKSFYFLTDELRAKARETSWTILRSAYREISCFDGSGTRDWLVRSLALQGTSPGCQGLSLDDWLEEKGTEGHIRKKEGFEGRWVICRIQR